MRRTRLFVFGLLTGLLAATSAAEEHRPITAQDLWAIQRVGAPALSPDGRTAVVAVTGWSIPRSKSTSSLWLVDVASATTRRLTQGGSDAAPVWSPDGKRIAFVSKRGDDDAAALYVIAADGGEARRVAGAPYGLRAPKWLTNRRLAALTQVIPELAGELSGADLDAVRNEMKRRKDAPLTARVTEDRQYRFWDHPLAEGVADKLVAIDAETGAFQDLTPGWKRVFSTVMEPGFEVSPDGKSIAMAINSTAPPYHDHPNLDVYLIPTDGSGSLKNLTPENEWSDDRPRFSPDGRSIVFSRTRKKAYEHQRLWRRDLAAETSVPLTDGVDLSFDDHEFSPDGRTLFLVAEDRGRVALFRMGTDGKGLSRIYGEGTSTGLRARAGAVVFLNETSSRPGELFALDPAKGAMGMARRLTHFNDALMTRLALGKTESREFTGAEGDRVQMWVTYPPDFDPAKKYPLVQLLHGGPWTMARDDFSLRWNAHVFAAAGWVVARVNRHGSTGFGEAFAQSIDRHWGDRPMADVLAGTDELAAHVPGVDGDRVAAAGASYGGYLAAWLLGHTDRFRCIVDHSGLNDVTSEYGMDLTYYFGEATFGGTPWENAETLQKNNPMAYARNFKTPTLVTAGEMDYRVPYANATGLYGVLQAMGVPSRLVLFPNENHWVLTPQNSIYWYYEVRQWLTRYLGGRPMEKPVFSTAEEK
jgi:dipeptidyl aminopeptidase/acylaminoacyl peptidase